MLLLATNLGLAAMAHWQPVRQQPLPPAADPGVAKLVLLAERENAQPEAQSAELAEAPATPAENARDACQSVGPFLTQSDLRRAMTALTPWVKRIRSRQVNLQQSRGWSVFLPAPASREEALDIARQLYARGVRDYYVVTAGEQQNTISLGLFRERGNAEKRRAEVAGMGFSPVIAERKEELPSYWVDWAQNPGVPFRWQTQLPNLADVEEKTIPCF